MMKRATLERLGIRQQLEIPIATAEDIIISKLVWYRKGNESSDRQWDDVFRLIKLLGSSADLSYLRSTAETAGVIDLLERLLSQ